MAYTDKNALYNTNLKAILNEIVANINAAGGTRVLDNPEVAIGSSDKAKVKTSEFSVMKDGVITKISSAETEFTATDHDIAADSSDAQSAIYVVYLDGTTVKLEMGDVADDGDEVVPATPSGKIKVGEVKVKVDEGSTDFDATTDDLDAEHLTATFTSKIDVAAGIS